MDLVEFFGLVAGALKEIWVCELTLIRLISKGKEGVWQTHWVFRG